MKKNVFLIIILCVTIFNINIINVKAESLPPCDMSFYNMNLQWSKDNVIGSEFKLNLLDGVYSSGWKSTSKTVLATFQVNKKNLFKDLTFTIIEQRKDKTEKEVCSSTITPTEEFSKGDTIGVQIIFGDNKSSNGETSCSSGTGWTYGHVYKIKVSGRYYNYTSKNGEISSYGTKTQNVKKCGQYYDTNKTPKTTPKTDESGALESTTVPKSTRSGEEKDTSADYYQGSEPSNESPYDPSESDVECSDISSLVNKYWKYVMILVPIVLILLITIDFLKPIISSDTDKTDQLKNSANQAVKRTIATVILLILPALLSVILKWFGLKLCL